MFGNNKSNSKASFNVSSYTVTIAKDGTMKKGSTAFSVTGSTGNTLNFLNSSGTEIHAEFSDKLLVGQYSFSSWPSNDLGYYVKLVGEDTTSDASKYKVSWVSFGGSGNRYFVAEVYYNNELYTCSFFDTNSEYYDYYLEDVSFEFTSGSSITDAGASYAVKVGDTVLGHVTGKTSFEYVPQADEVVGTYTSDAGELVLDGFGAATYAENNWEYDFEGSTVTLTRNEGSVVYTTVVTLDGSTFTVVSEDSVDNLYIGRTYVGSFEDSDGYGYQFTISFTSNDTANVAIRMGTYGTGVAMYPFANSHPNGGIDNYTFNEDGSITLTMYDGSTPKTVTLVPNDDFTTLTITNNFNNGYPTAGCVLEFQA